MKKQIKELIRRTPAGKPLLRWSREREVKEWIKNGRGAPSPHLIKQQALREYAQKYNLKILVETGTFYGDMIEALKDDFEKLYSIELNEFLHKKAVRRFADLKHIELIQGDSGIRLRELMDRLDKPTLFWLDGHYSGGITSLGDKETPILEELGHIFSAPDQGHVILIDDARCFGNDPGYPGIDKLRAYILSKRPNVKIEEKEDSIRITNS